MARRRQPVEPLQEAVQAQPQARPADFGTTAAPLSLPVFDFAGISRTLSDFLAEQSEKRAAEKSLEAQRFVQENSALVADIESDASEIKDPAEQDRFLRESFAFLKSKGIIPPMGDPYSQIGYARAAGRLMADTYRDRLRARLDEMSAVRGPDGEPTLAPDVEAAMAEEWGRVSNSPAVRNFYGGREALGQKERADEEFRTTVSARRAEAQQRDYEDLLKREIGGQFDYILRDNPVVTGETLSGITEYVSREVQQHNIPRPRELVMEAIELSIQRQAAVDPEEAVRMVHAAQDLVVGDVRLGDDRSGVGLRLEELTRRVRDRANEASLDELRREQSQRQLAVQQAEKEYIPLLVRAKQEGQSVRALAKQLGDRYLAEDAATGRFGGRAAFVVDALNDYANAQDGARQSDQQVLDSFHRLLAEGETGAAETLLRASQTSLTGEDYLESLNVLSARRDVSRLVEDNSVFRTVANRYAELKPTGFTPDVQQRVDDQAQELRVRMERDYVALVQQKGQVDRAWLEERWAADQKELRRIEQEVRGDRDAAEIEVRRRMARHLDAADLIDQGERAGAFTVTEAQDLREQNVKAAEGREALLNSRPLQEATQSLARRLADEDPAVFEAGLRELRDRYAVAVDEILGNDAVDPRSFGPRADAELRRVQRELEDQLFPSVEGTAAGRQVQTGAGKAERQIAAGKSAEEVRESQAVLDADLKAADQLTAVTVDPITREQLTDRHPYFDAVRHPAISPDFYRYAAAWMSGADPVFGSPVQRSDVESRARSAIGLAPEEQRSEVAGAVVDVIGIDATAVLAERLELAVPDDEAAFLRREIEARERFGGILAGGVRAASLPAFRARLEPVSVDLTGKVYRPFTTPFFRSLEAMEAFSDDPAWPDFLRRVGIDPEDISELRAFEDAQAAAIQRTPR